MPQKDIRDILGLEEGEPLVRDEVDEKELTKRFKKVAEYKRIAERRKRPDWNRLRNFTPSPNPGLGPDFYNSKPLRKLSQNIANYFTNIKNYFSGNKYETN